MAVLPLSMDETTCTHKYVVNTHLLERHRPVLRVAKCVHGEKKRGGLRGNIKLLDYSILFVHAVYSRALSETQHQYVLG